MGTTADKLNAVLASKNAIRDAITEKIGEPAGDIMSAYAEKIRGIGGGQTFYTTTILIDQTISDPATMITKVYDDGAIAMIRANSHRYVCNMVDGVMQAKQLQDNNGTLYIDGTTADLTGAEGDVMMKLPQFYYKAWSKTTDKWYVDFLYGELPESPIYHDYKEWDGKDFIGVYEASVKNEKLYSLSGQNLADSITQRYLITYANNRGEGYTLVKWKHHCIMAFLFLAYYSNTNSQAICGAGTKNIKASGQTDILGMEDTGANITGNSQSINFWGLENWWGNIFEWIGNVVVNDSNVGRWTITEDDGNSRVISGVATTTGYIGKIKVGDFLDVSPTSVGSVSTTSGFCDNHGGSTTTNRRLMRSYWENDVRGGVFGLHTEYTYTSLPSRTGSRLAYRGEYKIIE